MNTFVYKTIGGLALKADVYTLPDTPPHPVVLWLHGGALIFGDRSWVRDDFRDFCAHEGFVLVSLEYRLAPETKLPGIISDLEEAWRWVHEEGPALFHADTSRMAVAGNSAGGYLTMMAGIVCRPVPTALVAYWGYGAVDEAWYTTPHYLDRDFSLLSKDDVVDAEGRVKDRQMYYIHLRQQAAWPKTVTGFDPQTEQNRLKPYNPKQNITPQYPPILMIHGTEDYDVPYSASVAMADALARQNRPHELLPVPGAGHELVDGDPAQVAAAHQAAQVFIKRHLKA